MLDILEAIENALGTEMDLDRDVEEFVGAAVDRDGLRTRAAR